MRCVSFALSLALVLVCSAGVAGATEAGRTPGTSASVPASDGAPAATTTSSPTKEELEIAKLQQEVDFEPISRWLQGGTLGVALVAAAVSFWSAYQSQRGQVRALSEQVRSQTLERVSGLLKELGSANPGVRTATIQALSDYPDTYRFLCNLLMYEEDFHVVDSLIAVLRREPELSIGLLVEATVAIRTRMLGVAGRLSAAGMPRREIAETLGLRAPVLAAWLESSRGRQLTTYFSLVVPENGPVEGAPEGLRNDTEVHAALESWLHLLKSHRGILAAIEAVAETAAQSSLVLDFKGAYLEGVVLDGLNMTRWDFRDADLSSASLERAVCDKAVFHRANLEKSSFMYARMRDTRIREAMCREADFSKATLGRSVFRDCDCEKARFTAAKAKSATFEGTNLVQAKLNSLVGEGIRFIDVRAMGADLRSAIVNEGIFEKVDFHGAKLRGVSARRASFDSVEFVGSKLAGGDFRGGRFTEVRFEHIDDYPGTRFEGCSVGELEFDESSRAFEQHFQQSARGDYVRGEH